MRKKLFVITFVVAILLMSNPVSSQVFSTIDTLRIEEAQGDPGDTLTLGFDLVNTFGVGGVVYRVVFDSTVFVADTVVNTPRTSLFDLNLVNMAEPGIVKYLSTSFDPFDNYIISGSGDICILTMHIKDTAPDGVYEISFENEDSLSFDNSITDSSGNVLVVPILENGIITVGDPIGIDEEIRIPHQFDLLQNYPNPFNMNTTISFILDEKTEVSLEIFDLLGRKVADVFSGEAEAGKTTVNWDGRNRNDEELASGVYYYKVTLSDERSITKRMTLVK